MIPLRLQLRNFMSYRENTTPVLFDGFRIACLCGDNGHGKSALLDAITWSIWGRSRSKTEDELVHLGQKEMEVDFEFELGHQRFRVIRKRSLRGSGRAQAALDFQIASDGGYRSIAGNTVYETQRKIIDTLRLEYDTFVNSAFFLQGKADTFTLATPMERKRVLTELLGLDRYDRLETRAKELARTQDEAVRECDRKVQEYDGELERRPDLERDREAAAQQVELAQARAAALEADRDRLRDRRRDLDRVVEHKAELEQRLDDHREQIAHHAKQERAKREQVEAFERLLGEREAVERAYERLQMLRERDEELVGRQSLRQELTTRKTELALVVEKARSVLKRQEGELAGTITLLERKAAEASAHRAESAKIAAQIAKLQPAEAARDELLREQQQRSAEIDVLTTVNTKIEKDGKQIAEHIKQLQQVEGACPTCETPLEERRRQALLQRLEAHRGEHRNDYSRNRKAIDQHRKRIEAIDGEIAKLDEQLRLLAQLQRKLGGYERSLGEIDADAATLELTREQIEKVRANLSNGHLAPVERQHLALIETELATVAYDPDEHRRVKEELRQSTTLETRRARIESAAEQIDTARKELDHHQKTVERLTVFVQTHEQKIRELVAELAELPKVTAELRAIEASLQNLATEQRDRQAALDRLEQQLKYLDRLALQRAEKLAERSSASDLKGLYEELAIAFGKRGIQAMIIESVIPEIEREANELLSRLTDHRMTVKLETQRAAKTGDAVIETLDIKIADELGTRNYELFSGGEAFRANFAIRLALSKLLARRAGAQLQTLVIDEGFGTQDSNGLLRLIEAINAISSDFEKILVITHLDELKDQFPVRIDVIKTPEDGSQVLVA